ncbi:MAG: MEKHLA domain-containing protein [Gemmataceae bacterium]|nr:MEKHLA domain-containing protein [Gemmataceae bacterium]
MHERRAIFAWVSPRSGFDLTTTSHCHDHSDRADRRHPPAPSSDPRWRVQHLACHGNHRRLVMESEEREAHLLHSVPLPNAQSILAARQRGEFDLVNAREELQRQSEWLRITLASIGDAVITTDAEGRVTFLNGVAESLTGWALTDAAGRPLPEVFRIINERTRQLAENPALRALREGTVVGLANHTALIAKDGTERPIDDSAAPMRGRDGAAVGSVLVFRDVTERKRAEEGQARLAAIVESSEDAILSKTLDGIILSWNAGAERLFGYTAQETVGQPITLIIPTERRDEERAILERLRRGERIEHFETVRVSKDGRRLDISLTISPVRNAEGDIVGASKVARDISRRVRAEREHRQLVSIVETSTDLVGLASLDGRILYFNDAGLRLLGLNSVEQARTKSLFDFVPPEYLPTVEKQMLPALHAEGRWEGEWCYRNATTGRLVPVSKKVTLIRDTQTGEPIAFATVSRDVTDRIQAEEELRRSEERYRRAAAEASQAAEANAKFRAFFEQGTNFAGVLALDGRVIEANRLCLDACGFAREVVIGKPFWDCGWWNRSAALMDMVRAGCVQAAGGLMFRAETNYFIADGSERVVDLHLAPVTDEAGCVLFIAATGTDVTDRRRMEDSLRAADRKKDEFIALLAHELRNPLAPIRNGLQVMRLAGGDAGAADRAREMMDRQLSHMVRLIDDLLDISRINRNKMELRRSRVLLADVVSSAVETARPLLDAAGHDLTVSLPPKPVYLDADLTRLAQVFSNLLTNSVKYTERGGRIWVSAERRGGEVAVSVRDTGIGIPAGSLAQIFDMFAQVDRPIERSTGGLGIGLALVKGLVEMHGGTVTAQSDGQGQGSTFTVTLPVLATPEEPATMARENGQAATGPKRRILVVDDNRDGADSLAMMLGLMGNDVRTTYDGLQAIEVARQFLPQVVLMDVGMPRLDGLEATRRIRQHDWGRDMTIIALTGWGQDGDRERSHDAGCDGHLVKPVNLPDLEKQLSELVNERRASPQ